MMKARKRLIVLDRISGDPQSELDAMTAELLKRAPAFAGLGAKPSHWSRRFAPSGKMAPAANVRQS
jgi:hypothetical protein